jgi:hypothetical protein
MQENTKPKNAMLDKKLITVQELSEIVSISPYNLRKLAYADIIPSYRPTRKYLFDLDEVIEAIKKYKG